MQVLKRLFRLLVPYRTTLAVSVVLLLARAAVELLPPLFQRRIIDEVIGSSDLSRLGGAGCRAGGHLCAAAGVERRRRLYAARTGRAVHF